MRSDIKVKREAEKGGWWSGDVGGKTGTRTLGEWGFYVQNWGTMWMIFNIGLRGNWNKPLT